MARETVSGEAGATGSPQFRQITLADASEQQAERVMNLGDGPDSRSRGIAAVALVYGDGWWDSGDEVGVRFIKPGEELPGVGRKGLDVAAMPLGVERVKCE